MRKLTVALMGFCLGFIQSVSAQSLVDVRALLKDFNYAEFAEDGSVLDRETGILPGIGYGLHYRRSGIEIDFDVARYAALIDYDGHTQSGAEHTTQSGTVMWDVGINLRLHVIPDRHLFTFGLIDSSWERDILPAGSVLGLYEFYRWRTVRLGYEYHFQKGEHQLQAGIDYLTHCHSSMVIDFAAINPTKLLLKDSSGWQGEVQYAFDFHDQWQFAVQYQLQGWSTPRSNDILVDSDYGPLLIHEPRSETFAQNIDLRLTYRF